jgi:hypothetical protein
LPRWLDVSCNKNRSKPRERIMRFFWQREQPSPAGKDHSDFSASSFAASSFGASSMALLMVAPAPTLATGADVAVSVSATVLKKATLQVVSQPSAVSITPEDIARGYVDVAVPAHVAVKSNSPRGYMLEFASEGDFFREIVVRGLASEVQLGAAGGAVMQPASPSGITRAQLELGFRFLLADSARPGTYSWPVQLTVSPV